MSSISSLGMVYPIVGKLAWLLLSLLHHSGESGLGKSTLVDSLFLTDLYDDTAIPRVVGEFM